MSEQDFLITASEILKNLDAKSDKLDKRNKNAWNTIVLLAIFFLGSMGTGIYKLANLENQKADKSEVEKYYLKVERYEIGQLTKSKLTSAYMAKMAALAGGDSLKIKEAEIEYNYHIREIIKFSGIRGRNN
jgi:hypothetical protein